MSLLGAGLALSGVGMLGNILQARSSNKQQAQQYSQQASWQEKLAREGIQMRVADAKKAGIHPLAAIGAQGAYSSPVSVGGKQMADMSTFGQDVTRAAMAQSSQADRKLMDIQLSNAKLDNEMKQIEVTTARRRLAGQLGPGLPDLINGSKSGVSSDIQIEPARITSHAPGKPAHEAGHLAGTGFVRNADGSLTPVPSELVTDRIEDKLIPETQWQLENYLGPTGKDGEKYKPSKKYLPKGYKDWRWNAIKFKWEPVHPHDFRSGTKGGLWKTFKRGVKSWFK